jgi:hypothetical protein
MSKLQLKLGQFGQRGPSMSRFLTLLAALGMTTALACFSLLAQNASQTAKGRGETPKTFRVWVFADAHVGTDKKQSRESLAEAIRQSESATGFEWDIALDLGDMSGEQGTPKDPEGEEIVRQFSVLKQHRREDIYDLSGNHDRSGLDEPQAWWWRKWVDPTVNTRSFRMLMRRSAHFRSRGLGSDIPFESGISFS